MWIPPVDDNAGAEAPAQQFVKLTPAQIAEFKAALKAGPVEFTYYKTLKDKKGKSVKDENGNYVFDYEHPRKARGTMLPAMLPVPKKLEGDENKLDAGMEKAGQKIAKKRNMPEGQIFYFDLDANGFRCFKQDGLIEFAEA